MPTPTHAHPPTPTDDDIHHHHPAPAAAMMMNPHRGGGSSSNGGLLHRPASVLILFVGVGLLMCLSYLWGGSGNTNQGEGTQLLQQQPRAPQQEVSAELMEAIKREVRAEIYASMADENKQREESLVTAGNKKLYPPTAVLPEAKRKRVVVTGGAGFVGSHLVDRLMEQGHEVIVIDNMFTGRKKNVAHWIGHPNFNLIVHDVVEPIMLEVDQIYHLACPASPPHYQYNPIKTIKTSTMGTLNMLGLAKRVHARMLLTSTSEVYGDPQVGGLGGWVDEWRSLVVALCLPFLSSIPALLCLFSLLLPPNPPTHPPPQPNPGPPPTRVLLGQCQPYRPPRLLRRRQARG